MSAHARRLTPAALLARPEADVGRAPCPVHEGDRNSLAWKPRERGGWQITCFACSFSGDLADLYAAVHHVPLGEALRAVGTSIDQLPAWTPSAPPVPALEALCVRCGAIETFLGRTYRTPGRLGAQWGSTPALELACAGWELADGEAWGVCGDCLISCRPAVPPSPCLLK